MSNPFSGIIDSSAKTLFNNMIDAILYDDSLTVPCTLVYGDSKWTMCPNCTYSPVLGRSAGLYTSGGPEPFPDGSVCPYCNGKGKVADAAEESVSLAVIFGKSEWKTQLMDTTQKQPKFDAQTLSSLSGTYKKIKRAKYLILDSDISDEVREKFTLDGEPIPCGFGDNRYILCNWIKSG